MHICTQTLDHISSNLIQIQTTSYETKDSGSDISSNLKLLQKLMQQNFKMRNKILLLKHILTYRMSSPLVTVLRRRVLNPVWSIPGKPPMLGPKNASNRSKGLVCRRKNNFVSSSQLYSHTDGGCHQAQLHSCLQCKVHCDVQYKYFLFFSNLSSASAIIQSNGVDL